MLSAFWNGSYAPHAYCLFWDPGLMATHIIADSVIALSYFSIPVALVLLVRRRRDLAFGWVFWCFATFILACGLTHVMSIWTLYQGVYGLEAFVKVVTAIASVATAVLMWPLLPKAIALPSMDRLKGANAELESMIRERELVLAELRGEIEQRERAEQALLQSQKLEAVGQLTGGIAHDFNNLLQAIAGNLELIARRPEDAASVSRWTTAALEAVERGRALTGQLLAFSRRQKLDIGAVHLDTLLGGMRDLLDRAVAPLSTAEIRPIETGWMVQADPLQLELAILNLAFNARDAMPEGGKMTISAERLHGEVAPDLPAGDYVALTIADTGTGMTAEVAERALEPFFTTKDVGKGTGMGLSMAFGVMRQSHGTLTIDSAPGEGTRIRLFLPVIDGSAPAGCGAEAAAEDVVDLGGRSILLVDDDARVRAYVADALTLAGADVIEASDGASGIALAGSRKPDLLIVDFAMPRITGAEVARRAHEQVPALPILMITGFADSSLLEMLPDRVSLLRKPFESRELLRRVRELVEGEGN